MRPARFGLPAAGAMAVFLACENRPSGPAYSAHPAVFSARIRAEFSATRTDGKGGEFRTWAEAQVRLRRTDSAGGPMRMSLEVDSISYSSSERDSGETSFMRERLKKYRADWRMAGDGRVTELREEPELPRGDLTARLGPALAAALPIFSESPADTQSLSDPSDPGAVLVQRRRGKDGKACELRLAGAGMDGLKGDLKFRMDKKTGFPASLEMDVTGTLPAAADSGAVSAPAKMRFRYSAEFSHPPGS